MGHIFNVKSAELYKAWEQSAKGIAFDKLSSQLTLQLLQPKKGERVLDIGCGSGNHLLLFHRLGLDVSGIDASPCMLDRARSRLGNKACLKIGRAEDLPFENNEFDLATLIITLEFVDDPVAVLKEAGRVTKNKIFIGALNSLSLECIYNKVNGLFHASIFKQTNLCTLWGLKASARRAYGDIPLEWASTGITPSFLMSCRPNNRTASYIASHPFGTFLGLVCTLKPALRTENLTLAEQLKKRAKSPIESLGF